MIARRCSARLKKKNKWILRIRTKYVTRGTNTARCSMIKSYVTGTIDGLSWRLKKASLLIRGRDNHSVKRFRKRSTWTIKRKDCNSMATQKMSFINMLEAFRRRAEVNLPAVITLAKVPCTAAETFSKYRTTHNRRLSIIWMRRLMITGRRVSNNHRLRPAWTTTLIEWLRKWWRIIRRRQVLRRPIDLPSGDHAVVFRKQARALCKCNMPRHLKWWTQIDHTTRGMRVMISISRRRASIPTLWPHGKCRQRAVRS